MASSGCGPLPPHHVRNGAEGPEHAAPVARPGADRAHQPPLQHLPFPWSFPSTSISETAAAEKLDRDYLGRILQLTLLAPDIVEKILDGLQPEKLTLPRLMEPLPACWEEQGCAAAAPYAGTRCGWPA